MKKWELSSAVEQDLYTVKVIGSIPIAPTINSLLWASLAFLLSAGCSTPQQNHWDAPDSAMLKEAATSSGRLVGSEVEAELLQTDSQYAEIVRREFSIIVPQNEMKLGWVGKKRGTYNFSDADTIVGFAQKNGMKVRGTTFAWHRNYPKWLKEGSHSSKELEGTLVGFINASLEHFRSKFAGTVIAWDVVNEAVGKDGNLRNEAIWSKIDPSDRYIELAFRTARKADPKVLLFYNDFATEEINRKSDGVYKLLSDLKAKGVPVDGVGFQMHLDYREDIDLASVRRNFDRFAKLGLKIHITEFDYQLPEKPTAAQLDREAKAYHDFAEVCASTPACEAFVSWGVYGRALVDPRVLSRLWERIVLR